MSQANWQKAMRNTAITERPPAEKRSRPITVGVELTQGDKNRVNNFIKAETEFYNTVNRALMAKSRAFPHELIEIDERGEKLFGDVAYQGFNLRSVYNKGDMVELPETLEKHRHYIFSKNDAGNRLVNESFLILTETVSRPVAVHPEVRRRMAIEILKFYRLQAKGMMQTQRNRDGEIEYRQPGEVLEVADTLRKRHLQIPREIVRLEYDSKNDETLIKNPFCSPLVVENMNLKDNARWNLIILHQVPGSMALSRTPWVLDFKQSQQPYMIKYLDVRSPNAGGVFHAAKAGQGRH